MDEAISREIFEWDKNIQLTSIQGKNNSIPEYSLKFSILQDDVALEVARDIVGQATKYFKQVFEARNTQNLSLIDKIVKFPDNLKDLNPFILEISSDYYTELTKWENWVDSEIFSGRYVYKFFYPGSYDFLSNGLDGTIEDTKISQTFYLDPWDGFDDAPGPD